MGKRGEEERKMNENGMKETSEKKGEKIWNECELVKRGQRI